MAEQGTRFFIEPAAAPSLMTPEQARAFQLAGVETARRGPTPPGALEPDQADGSHPAPPQNAGDVQEDATRRTGTRYLNALEQRQVEAHAADWLNEGLTIMHLGQWAPKAPDPDPDPDEEIPEEWAARLHGLRIDGLIKLAEDALGRPLMPDEIADAKAARVKIEEASRLQDDAGRLVYGLLAPAFTVPKPKR
jgi:hypothetical protein